jgi:hypothetical protein
MVRAVGVAPPLVWVRAAAQSEKMTEQWIRGCHLQRIMFRDGLVLNLDDYNELVIAAPMRLTVPPAGGYPAEVIRVDPMAIGPELRPLFNFCGAECTEAGWDDDGDLHLEFSVGHRIDVPHDERATAWELYGKHHGYVACMPHGKVRVVRHDLPDDDEGG